MTALVAGLAGAVMGALVGSFLATLILRWPAGRTLGGRSCCDGCGRTLSPVELVPLSALVLRRCATCGSPIDPLHPAIELGAALVGAAALALAPSPSGMAVALAGWLLLTLAVLDLRHWWLPDRLVAALALGGAVLGATLAVPLVDRLIGGAVGFAALEAIRLGYRQVRKREGMGQGDPKLLGAIGLWTGWTALPGILLMAALGGLAFALAARRRSDSALPFGACLAAAAMAWLLLRLVAL